MASKQLGKIFLRIHARTLLDENQRISHLMKKWQAEAARRRALMKNNADAANEVRVALYEHRRNVMRPEARAVNLAKAFISGLNWVDVERTIKFEQFGLKGLPIDRAIAKVFDRVIDLVHKNGGYQATKTQVAGAVLLWMEMHPQILDDSTGAWNVRQYIRYKIEVNGLLPKELPERVKAD